MWFGVDASRAAIGQRTGTENYSLHLIRRLLALNCERGRPHRYTLYFNQSPSPSLFPDSLGYEARAIPLPRLWTHLRLSLEMAQRAPEVLLVPAHVLPLVHPRRSVVTIHDLGYLYYPQAHSPLGGLYLRLSTAYNARFATRIIADSQATKEDIVRHLGVNPKKVTVVYPAVAPEFYPREDEPEVEAIRAKYGLPARYVLYVGTLHPRKNILRLLEAYVKLLDAGEADASLVIAGKRGWLPSQMEGRLSQAPDKVIFTGYVPTEDLPFLYSGATAFVMPSLYEGFGLPIVEAMSCGTPVLAAKASSLPEVAGDAAVLFDPLSVEDIVGTLARVLSDEGLRAGLREKGLHRARCFSWQGAAEEATEVLEQAGQG